MSAFKDLTGQTINGLYVDHLVSLSGMQDGVRKNTVWWCICGGCGGGFRVVLGNLTRTDGKGTKSCGCQNGKNMNLDTTPEIGKRFDHLVFRGITEERDESGCGLSLWSCDCGRSVKRTITDVTCYPHVRSCSEKGYSCPALQVERPKTKFIDLTGQTFGKLTVVRLISRANFYKGVRHTTWWCKCSCGKELRVTTGKLRGNKSKKGQTACGCQKGKNHKSYRGKPIIIPEIGQRFNWLVFRGFANERDKFRKICGYFDCDYKGCTTRNKKLPISGVRLNKIRSCGCAWEQKKQELGQDRMLEVAVGVKINRLTLRYICPEPNRHGQREGYWECDCHEGELHRIAISCVIGNHTRSCGCLQREAAANSVQLRLSQYADDPDVINNLASMLGRREQVDPETQKGSVSTADAGGSDIQ